LAIHAVIFDLGGVIVRTEDWHPRNALAERLATSRDELESLVFGDGGDYRAQLGEITAQEQWDHVRQKLGMSASDTSQLQEQFFGGDRLDQELVDYIRDVKHDYITALLSNAPDNLRGILDEKWDITDAFHHIIISAEVGVMKPDPAIYQLALARLGVAAEDAVFIDDMQANVQGALDIGMHAIHFRSADLTRAELEGLLSN